MYFDILILIILLIGLFTGLKNGLFTEVISIFGFVINIIVAKIYTPVILKFFKRSDISFGNNYFITYVVTFIAVYLVISIILCFVKKAFSGEKLGFINRMLGGILGFFKGLIVSAIVVLIYIFGVTYFPAIQDYSRDSKAIEIFHSATPIFENYIPDFLIEKLNKDSTKKFIEKNINTTI